MEPLIRAVEFHQTASDFFKSHSADEARHAEMLKNYLWKTFRHEKKDRTLTDRLIYDRFFPWAGRLTQSRPMPALAGLLFYEIFVGELYDELRSVAKSDGLEDL